jgi:phage FluMu gp28-like protein
MSNNFFSDFNSSRNRIDFPDTRTLLPHQRQILFEDPQRFKVCCWHRRARKTSTAIIEETKQAQMRVGAYWHVFPTYAEAKDAVWRDPTMLFNLIPKEFIEKKNEAELIVYFKNGSYLQLKGADTPERLLGAGPVGVVLDEYAMMKRETWDRVVQPILRGNGGWCWFISTPKGKNHFWEMFQQAKANPIEWNTYWLSADTSGIIAPDQLEAARLSMPENLYNQEMLCTWLEGEGSVFRGVRDIMTAKPEAPKTGHYYIMGVDLAKVRDYTVISIYDTATNNQVYQDRFNKLEYPYQKKKIIMIAKHYNNALVQIDATGLGDPITDDLLRAGVIVDPIKITEPLKKEMVEKLSIWIEQRKIRMINLEQTAFEFDNFSYQMGPTGRIRYGAIGELHDDIVIANALAVYKLNIVYKPVINEEATPIRKYYLDQLKGYDKTEEAAWSEWDSE